MLSGCCSRFEDFAQASTEEIKAVSSDHRVVAFHGCEHNLVELVLKGDHMIPCLMTPNTSLRSHGEDSDLQVCGLL
jgi:hypothetical protein